MGELILSIIICLLLFVVFNLFRKNEKLEEILINQNEHIDKIHNQIIDSSNKLKIIDERGTFESDDEIGWFFDGIKDIQKNLDTFSKK